MTGAEFCKRRIMNSVVVVGATELRRLNRPTVQRLVSTRTGHQVPSARARPQEATLRYLDPDR